VPTLSCLRSFAFAGRVALQLLTKPVRLAPNLPDLRCNHRGRWNCGSKGAIYSLGPQRGSTLVPAKQANSAGEDRPDHCLFCRPATRQGALLDSAGTKREHPQRTPPSLPLRQRERAGPMLRERAQCVFTGFAASRSRSGMPSKGLASASRCTLRQNPSGRARSRGRASLFWLNRSPNGPE